jgi:hypothetical protein
MGESSPKHEPMSEELLAFYNFIFDNNIKQISLRIFDGDALRVGQNMEEYKDQHPGTSVRVMHKGFDDVVGMPWLSGCNVESNVFLVVQPSSEDRL